MTKTSKLFLSLSILLIPSICFAQLSFSVPAADTAVTLCADYFNSEQARNVDGTIESCSYSRNECIHGDFLYNLAFLVNGAGVEIQQLSKPSYANGIITQTVTGNTPQQRLETVATDGQLYFNPDVTSYGTNHPIKTGTYNTITVRQWSDVPSDGISFRWEDHDNNVGLSGLQETYEGWHTYQLDLRTVNTATGQIDWLDQSELEGFAILPNRNASGATIKTDFVALNACCN